MCGLMTATGQTMKGVSLLWGAIDPDHQGDLLGATQ